MQVFRYPGENQILDDNQRTLAPGSFVQLSGGITHYELEGLGDGDTVVLIHGFSIPFQIWEPIFYPLVKSGFHVLRYDLFGRGFSDRPEVPYSQDLFDQQLLDLILALEVKLPVSLIGLSMGAVISIGFCHRHPELIRKIILIDPSGFPLKFPVWGRLIKAPIIGELLLSLFGDRYLISSIAEDLYKAERYPEYVDIVRKQMRIKGYRSALLSTLRHGMLDDHSMIYREVGKQKMSSCLIWGIEDRIIPFETNERVREAIPEIEFHPIPEAGHVPHYEYPEIVLPILIDFLGRGEA
jgi:pimeloyl-ACP methyl ester carboxylesterase